MKLPCVLTIAGSDSGGGAGIQADLKTFAAFRVHGLSVITSLTAQNTRGVQSIFALPSEFVWKQLESVVNDFEIKWAKTGMLCNSDIIRKIREWIKVNEIKLVVDPVMMAASGAPLLEEKAIRELKELLRSAKLVTPNVPEAHQLSGINIGTLRDVRAAARKISAYGPESVLIKGGHLSTDNIHNILYKKNKFWEFEEPRIPGGDVHGTGCTFSATIVAQLAKGLEVKEAIAKAGEFVADAVRGQMTVGKGLSVINPLARVWKVTCGGREIMEVQKAAQLLVEEPKFADFIPEVGTNIVMALDGAENRNEVIGLSGRIIRVAGEPQLTGPPVPGGSEHVANIVLAAMQRDQQVRAGMNVRFHEGLLEKFGEFGLRIAEFDRRQEPPDVKTMSWGTEQAIKKAGEVPDVIFDRGAVGKEPMIRILGKSATEVAKRALQIINKYYD